MSLQLEFPYLLLAPDYRESSLGIQVMHRLCHIINEAGGKAWMVGGTVNPQWNTPALTDEEYQALISGFQPWIAVYPEVVSGNPLSAPVSVRYMLNRESVIAGNTIDAGPDDLFFWYRDEFADKEPNVNLLSIECYDFSLFQDDNPVKDRDFLYLNRVPESVVDYSVLPENITVLSMRNPLPLSELALMLKRGRVLYTFEASGTCVLANLCGCPVVAMRALGYEHYSLNEQTFKDMGGAGFGYFDSPQALDEIRAGLPRVREHMLKERHLQALQMDNFLQMTQQKARAQDEARFLTTFGGWLQNRTFPVPQNPAAVAILHVIFCREAFEHEIVLSLNSLIEQGVAEKSVLLVVGDAAAESQTLAFGIVDENAWIERVMELAEARHFDWLHCIDAGTEYAPASIAMMNRVLSQAGECRAIFTDEALRHENGEVTSVRKPDFNLDLFLSSPHRYLKRVWFRRDAWIEAGGFSPEAGRAFEFEFLVNDILQRESGGIGHIADITTIVPVSQFNQANVHEEEQVLRSYLQRRKYNEGRVERQNNASWRLIYDAPKTQIVSILIDAGEEPERLVRCLESLINNTEWPYREVLLAVRENAGEAMLQVVQQLQEALLLKAVICEAESSYASRMTLLEQEASGEYLLLLNVHTLFVLKQWLTVLVSHAQRPEIGCVGPKIITLDQRLLSAGMIVGANGWFGHIGQGESWQSEGYLGRYQSEQNYSAISGNCLLIRRELWQQAGGIPEGYTDEGVIEVIASLTFRVAGFMNVWTPFSVVASDNARLVNSNLQGVNEQRSALLASIPEFFAEDPAYNVNLMLQTPLFSADKAPFLWQYSFSDNLPRVLLIENIEENEYSLRIGNLLQVLSSEGLIVLERGRELPLIPELMRRAPAAIVLTGAPDENLASRLAVTLAVLPVNVYALADAPGSDIQWQSAVITKWLTWSAGREAQLTRRKIPVVRLPIVLMPEKQDEIRKTTGRQRVVCMPGDASESELAFIERMIVATSPSVDWIIAGSWPKRWVPLVAETVRFSEKRITQRALSQLKADKAIVFRHQGEHNRFKDEYLAIQLAVSGIDVIASDVDSLSQAISSHCLRADLQVWQQAILTPLREGVPKEKLSQFIWDRDAVPESIHELFL